MAMHRIVFFMMACASTLVANARLTELPEWMFGMEIASIGSTGQWVKVTHVKNDWTKVKVVRAGGNPTGRIERVAFVSRDISDIWDDKKAMFGFRMRLITPHFFYRGAGSSTSTRYASVLDDKSGVVLSSIGLAGDFRFRERDDGTKTLRYSVRLMTDEEWTAWTKAYGEPPPMPPPAGKFPERLFGVDLPPVAPPDAELYETSSTTESSDYGKNKFKYWRERGTPIDHPFFSSRENEYTWATKTLCKVHLSNQHPTSLTDGERKAIEDKIRRLAEADDFKISETTYESGDDPAERPWDFQLEAERPDGIRLFAYVYRIPKAIRESGKIPCDDILRVSICLGDDFTPSSKIWKEGRCEE